MSQPSRELLAQLTVAERELVKEMGARWLTMSTREILSENAVLFRLAVAIVGQKMDEEHEQIRGNVIHNLTTGAGDYDEAVEVADRIVGKSTASIRNSK